MGFLRFPVAVIIIISYFHGVVNQKIDETVDKRGEVWYNTRVRTRQRIRNIYSQIRGGAYAAYLRRL